MPPNFIKRIPIASKTLPLLAEDCVVMQAGLEDLRDWHQEIQAPYIGKDRARIDRRWHWPFYYYWAQQLNEPLGRVVDALQINVRRRSPGARPFVPVGQIMLVEGYPHPDEEDQASSFVWFLAATPEKALQAAGIQHHYVVLPLLLDTAIQASFLYGFNGRIALHAANKGTKQQRAALLRRYLQCGLQQLPQLKGKALSLTRTMDARYCVHTPASALLESQKWDHLR